MMTATAPGKISLALGGSKKLAKTASTKGIKRSHAALDDNEEDDHDQSQAQTISHFDTDAGGAIDELNKPKQHAPLIIQPQANRDWREASQRKRSRNGPHQGLQDGRDVEAEPKEDEKPVYGPNIRKKVEEGKEAQTNGHTSNHSADEAQDATNGDFRTQPLSADAEALSALLGTSTSTKPTLIVPAITEEEAFTRDVASAPEMATLDDYARVPVEEFGAAMLRGMGWKEGEGIGVNRGKKLEKTTLPKRRPALLGIGAKEEAAVAAELGTWGRAAKDRKGGGEIKIYNPVLLKDKRTGELFTEKEAEERKAKAENEKYEVEFEREEKERRRRERSGSRDRDQRDRDTDRGSKKERRDRDDRDRRRYDSDEEYYRKKEKDRRRRERDREDSDYDRDRSRRHDSGREHHRDKDRHRDRRR